MSYWFDESRIEPPERSRRLIDPMEQRREMIYRQNINKPLSKFTKTITSTTNNAHLNGRKLNASSTAPFATFHNTIASEEKVESDAAFDGGPGAHTECAVMQRASWHDKDRLNVKAKIAQRIAVALHAEALCETSYAAQQRSQNLQSLYEEEAKKYASELAAIGLAIVTPLR